jgi:nucleolar GTP-binding protein
MIFILDPSESCGYSLEVQNKLLDNIRANFSDVPIIVVQSKCDIMTTDDDVWHISTVSGDGMEAFKEELVTMLRKIFREKAREAPLEEE